MDFLREAAFAAPVLVTVAATVVATIAVGHVILNKREVRAAIGWAGLIVLSPFVGALLYYMFGINRIRRRASRMAVTRPREPTSSEKRRTIRRDLDAIFDGDAALLNIAVGRATGASLFPGQLVDPLVDGDVAYPSMLQAIDEAKRSVLLSTYIFDDDRAGRRFVDRLGAAVQRGVEVRVLIDGVGRRYSSPPVTYALRREGVRAASFLPPRIPLLRNPYMNLRNHRKILVVDRRVAFTGGMNIREGCILQHSPRHPLRDLHFRIEGPVGNRIFDAAHEDWHFATSERLDGTAWEPGPSDPLPGGDVFARGIPDGPDEDFETIHWTILAALGAARTRVAISTPYFLPERALIDALRLAVLRDVEVDLIVPQVNNLRIVQWASTTHLRQAIDAGCRVWLAPPPFDHTKLMLVDDYWTLLGSANWDERSLRLNFEYDVECYDRSLAARCHEVFDAKRSASTRLAPEVLASRSLPFKLRDGLARLFSPYL